jgi:antitoxin (DNA-binding transcriptional repressor) of toxin-antitoxin stability system
MKTLTVGHLKSQFSQVLMRLKNGEEYTVAYGKKKEKIAVMIPYKKYISMYKKRIGVLEGKGKIVISGDFKLSDEEFLKS